MPGWAEIGKGLSRGVKQKLTTTLDERRRTEEEQRKRSQRRSDLLEQRDYRHREKMEERGYRSDEKQRDRSWQTIVKGIERLNKQFDDEEERVGKITDKMTGDLEDFGHLPDVSDKFESLLEQGVSDETLPEWNKYISGKQAERELNVKATEDALKKGESALRKGRTELGKRSQYLGISPEYDDAFSELAERLEDDPTGTEIYGTTGVWNLDRMIAEYKGEETAAKTVEWEGKRYPISTFYTQVLKPATKEFEQLKQIDELPDEWEDEEDNEITKDEYITHTFGSYVEFHRQYIETIEKLREARKALSSNSMFDSDTKDMMDAFFEGMNIEEDE